MKWIYFTAIYVRNLPNFVNNQRYRTHYTALKFKDRYMSCTGIFLSTCKINLLELNFKRCIVTTEWQCVQISVYPITAVTEVARIISICKLTDTLPHQTLQQLQFCLTNPGRKEISLSLPSFNVNLDSFHNNLSVEN